MTQLSTPTQTDEAVGTSGSDFDVDERGTFRALVEAFVSLFIAVLLFRTFAAEGYMISTGSMAPCLLGFHKRIVCPTCQVTFPFGTAYDTDEDPDAESVVANRTRAVCPNCGQHGIDVSEVPRNHGDQLLVNKQAYLYRSPRRWDVIVFRNPAHPTEAYVKRAVGLPGERIQIQGGDVVIDGQVARKNYQQQLATRILVHDHDFRPTDDDEFEPHWKCIDETEDDLERSRTAVWTAGSKSFQLRGGNVRRPDKTPLAWVEYHHWLRSGGVHDTSVTLAQWPEDLDSSLVPDAGLKFDPKNGEFHVTGALSKEVARKLMELTTDQVFYHAVQDLYEASHIVPISDEYGYNPPDEVGTPNPVIDLMFSARVAWQGGAGEFVVEMTNGASVFSVVFDIVRREVSLFSDALPDGVTLGARADTRHGESEPVLTAPWPSSLTEAGGLIEVSLIDRQVLIAINGQPVLEPAAIDMPKNVQPPRVPVRFGARGVDIKFSNLKLYRDVYYTESRSRHAVNRPYELGPDEFFVLGDNSPVSHDSRRWDKPTVPRKHLIGKPFLVHLPSKPGNLRVGSQEIHLRIPDWERIRFLR